MASRTDLQTIFENLLESDAVYFQPPSTFEMIYPCIIYQRSRIDSKFANNAPYGIGKRYMVTVIDENPDSLIPDKVASLPGCIFDRHYVKDNLNHDVFTLHF